MPRRSSKGRDFVAIARNVVEKAIGEHLDGTPLENLDEMCGTPPAQASAAKRINKGLILKALGETAHA